MSKHKSKSQLAKRFWRTLGNIAMFVSILFGSVIVGLAFAYTTLEGYWWLVPALTVVIAIPTAFIVAKWPYWRADRRARARTIEVDFTGLQPGQRA